MKQIHKTESWEWPWLLFSSSFSRKLKVEKLTSSRAETNLDTAGFFRVYVATYNLSATARVFWYSLCLTIYTFLNINFLIRTFNDSSLLGFNIGELQNAKLYQEKQQNLHHSDFTYLSIFSKPSRVLCFCIPQTRFTPRWITFEVF